MTNHVIRVNAKFTMPSGKTLKEIAAASDKLDKGFAALAAEIGIEVAAIEHTAQPVREASKEAPKAPPASPPAPPADDGKDSKSK